MSAALNLPLIENENRPTPPRNVRPQLRVEPDRTPVADEAPAADSSVEPRSEEPARASDQPVAKPGSSVADLIRSLDGAGREWTSKSRELEQHREHLASARVQQDLVYEQLARIVPVVQETYRSLKTAIESREVGSPDGGIAELAAMNARALEELEKIAGTMNAQAAWHSSAWERYCVSVEEARRLRLA